MFEREISVTIVEGFHVLKHTNSSGQSVVVGHATRGCRVCEVSVQAVEIAVDPRPHSFVPRFSGSGRKVSKLLHIERMQSAPESIQMVSRRFRKTHMSGAEFFFQESTE